MFYVQIVFIYIVYHEELVMYKFVNQNVTKYLFVYILEYILLQVCDTNCVKLHYIKILVSGYKIYNKSFCTVQYKDILQYFSKWKKTK